MNKSRELYYYFGRNAKHDYVAFKMRNCIVAGRTGAGKSVFLNNVLIRLIQECHPNDIEIYYHDCKGVEARIWTDSIPMNKVIPQLKQIKLYGWEETEYSSLTDTIIEFKKELDDRARMCEQLGVSDYTDIPELKAKLLIIDEYQAYVEATGIGSFFDESIKEINEKSCMTGMYIMLLSQSNHNCLSDNTVLSFPIRIVTPCSDEVSNLFVGSNVAAMADERYGVVWVKGRKEYPEKLYVPFYPDTWIRKFIGYYSVRQHE